MSLGALIREAARLIVRSGLGGTVALTGAGISAESGVPTFRGKGGLWERFRPEELATPRAWEERRSIVWRWYMWRLGIVLAAEPNPAHRALVELERMGYLRCVVTQNVDGLHWRAGQRCVVELHGSILRARCPRCGYRVSLVRLLEEKLGAPLSSLPRSELRELPLRLLPEPPKCPRCGEDMRPDVVWFGEPLPSEALEEAIRLFSEARVALVVGTSAVVYPAAELPLLTLRSGGVIIEVNLEDTPLTPLAAVSIRDRAGEILPALVREVRALAP